MDEPARARCDDVNTGSRALTMWNYRGHESTSRFVSEPFREWAPGRESLGQTALRSIDRIEFGGRLGGHVCAAGYDPRDLVFGIDGRFYSFSRT